MSFPLIGSKACMMRGPKSLAGLIAYPVGPPKDKPSPNINTPTIRGFNPSVNSFVPIANKAKRSIKVAINSVMKFDILCLIAGPVEKQLI